MRFGKLIIDDVNGLQRQIRIDKATVSVGSAADNDIVLNDAAVDAHHIQIMSDPQSVLLLDLVESSSLLLDGAPLLQNPQPLVDGSLITLGSARITVRLGTVPVRTDNDLLGELLGKLGAASPPAPTPHAGSHIQPTQATSPETDLLNSLLAQNLGPASTAHTPPNAATAPTGPLPSPQLEPAPGVAASTGSNTPPGDAASTGSSAPTPGSAAQREKPAQQEEQPRGLVNIKIYDKELTTEVDRLIILKATITNYSTRVDQISIRVMGIDQSWITSLPVPQNLMPNKRAEVRIEIQPPRDPHTLADTYTLEIIAQSTNRPADQDVERFKLVILPYTKFDATLEPEQKQGWLWATYDLAIKNESNRSHDFELEAKDGERRISFGFKPRSPVLVKAGETRPVRLSARIFLAHIIGKAQEHNFNVTVLPRDARVEPLRKDAVFVQQPPLPRWVLALTLAAFVFACLALSVLQLPPLVRSAWAAIEPYLPGQNTPTVTTGIVVVSPVGSTEATTQTTATSESTTNVTAVTAPVVTRVVTPTASPTVLPTPTEEGAPVVNQFTVTPQEVAPGQPVRIAWKVEGAESVLISVFGNVQPAGGELEYRPTQTQEVQLVATSPRGKVARINISIRVVSPLITPSITPTPVPDEQVIKFDLVNDAAVTQRTEIQGTEYEKQNAYECFFRLSAPSLSLTKTARQTGYFAEGQTIDFELVATNNGGVPLSNVYISDDSLGESMACTPQQPANLAPGQSLTCSGSYYVGYDDVMNASQLTNEAIVVGYTAADRDITAQASVSVPKTRPSLALAKSAVEKGYARAGDVINYVLVATNDGDVPISNVRIEDQKLGQLSCDAPDQGGTLDPQATLTCRGGYSVTESDTGMYVPAVNNQAIASGSDPDGRTITSPQATASVPRYRAELGFSKTVSPATYSFTGRVLTYSLIATNNGNVPLSNVQIEDQKLGSLTCDSPGQGSILDPQQSLVCTGTYITTESDVGEGVDSVTNQAIARANDPDGRPYEVSAMATAKRTVPLNSYPSLQLHLPDVPPAAGQTADLAASVVQQNMSARRQPTISRALPNTPDVTEALPPARRAFTPLWTSAHQWNLLEHPEQAAIARPTRPTQAAGSASFQIYAVAENDHSQFPAQQPPPPSCLPQQVLNQLLGENASPPVPHKAVIYPPNSAVPDAQIHLLTSDEGEARFVQGVIGVITFPRSVSRVTVKLWHPPDSVTTYRLYALDEAGAYINSGQRSLIAVKGEYDVTVAGQVGRPIRTALIMGMLNQVDLGPIDLGRDITRADAPLFIKEIRIPLAP